jgi:hypothetical protein
MEIKLLCLSWVLFTVIPLKILMLKHLIMTVKLCGFFRRVFANVRVFAMTMKWMDCMRIVLEN